MDLLTRSFWAVGAFSFSLPEGPEEYPRWVILPCSRLVICFSALRGCYKS